MADPVQWDIGELAYHLQSAARVNAKILQKIKQLEKTARELQSKIGEQQREHRRRILEASWFEDGGGI